MGILGILFCFIPLIIALLVFSFGFKLKFLHQLIAILLGLVAVFPISVIQFFLPPVQFLTQYPILFALLKSILLYGLVEEIIKMLLLLPLPHKKLSLLQFFFLSFLMGLSLGCFESIIYFFDHLQVASSRGAQLIYTQIFTRIFTADIIHATCTALAGLFIYTCRAKPVRPSLLLLPILLHGIYDFFAGFQNNLRWFSIIVILLAIVQCRIRYTSLTDPD